MAADHQVVFLSFYGGDVPDSVPRYLKSGLERSGISVLKRDNKGSEDLRTVLNKIRESSFVLVIFSVGFAKSGECLDELALVRKRMGIGKLRMLLIYYYEEEPMNVIHVQRLFRNILQRRKAEEHKNGMVNGMEALMRTEVRLRNWREALKSVKVTSEFLYREEDDFIEEITKQVNKADGNQLAMSQRTVKERTEALVSDLRSMGLGFEGNFISESDSIHKLSEQCKEQLSKLISEETKNKEGANPIPVFEKSPTAHKQVFISFRGQDNIVSHLIRAFKVNGINVVADEMEGSQSSFREPISICISKRIKDSGIALVFFSENYAQSKWCLQELTVIKKYMDKGMLRVIPIFYKVEPSNVTYLMGEFGRLFRMHRETTDEATILTWQEALRSVVQIYGLVYHETRSEAEFVETIVVSVRRLLADLSSES